MVTAKERTLAAEGKTKPKKTKPTMRFTVNAQTVLVDASTLTIREQYLARKVIDDAEFPASAQFLAAGICWIVARRTTPDLTFDEVIDSITQADLAAVTDEVDDDSPEA